MEESDDKSSQPKAIWEYIPTSTRFWSVFYGFGTSSLLLSFYLLVRQGLGLPCLLVSFGESWFYSPFLSGYLPLVLFTSAFIGDLASSLTYSISRMTKDTEVTEMLAGEEAKIQRKQGCWSGVRIVLLMIVAIELIIDAFWLVGLFVC